MAPDRAIDSRALEARSDEQMYEVAGFRLRELREAEAEVERLRGALECCRTEARQMGYEKVLNVTERALGDRS